MTESAFLTKQFGPWTIHVYPEPDGFVDVQVPSSNGVDFYSVMWSKNGMSCECRSFEFRKTCRHVIDVKRYVESLRERSNTAV